MNNVIETNKLIAEFMKGEVIKVKFKDCYYHNSWDWLMPCYRKVINYTNSISPNNNYTGFGLYNQLKRAIIVADIENAHYYLVEFIKWYNYKNKQS